MQDIFNEQLVRKEKSTKDLLLTILIVLLTIILSFISFILIPSFASIIVIAVSFGAYYLIGNQKIEYEYIFTNGDLDIDCIYNKSKRKRKFSCKINDSEIMCNINDNNHNYKLKNAHETKDFSSGKIKENTYCFLISKDSKNIKIIIEPNEKLLTAFSKYMSPRKLIKKQ